MPRNHSLARMRLEECLTSHKDCHQHDIPALPDRVIDVENAETCRLIHPEGIRAQYVALSHCWGGQIEFKLEENIVDEFRDGFAISKLAKNFQHAIQITRRLGIRYLWIDCLCIIQDSTTDWLKQSKNMASVYSHATLTIYAMESATCQEGILTQENSPMIEEMRLVQPVCVNAYKARGFADAEAQLELVHIEGDEEEDSVTLDTSSILASRGWALQEYVLAPRRLIFGKNRVHWECLRGTQTMDGFALKDIYLGYRSSSPGSELCPRPLRFKPRGQELRYDYYSLVTSYVTRELTKSSDKLPAFSAIAQSAHHAIGGDYIAGIWTADLNRGLSWCHIRHQPLPTRYPAPSWSWARSNHLASFTASGCVFSWTALPLCASWKITLVDSTNPYGAIQSAQLDLKVFTKRLQFVSSYPWRSTECPQSPGPWCYPHQVGDALYLDFDIFEKSAQVLRTVFTNERQSGIYTIVVKRTENWAPMDYLLVAIMELKIGHSNRPRLLCLVIRRPCNATAEAYERVGLADISAPRNWQELWPRQSITLC